MTAIAKRDYAWYENVWPTGLNTLPFGMRERLIYGLPGRNIFAFEMGSRRRQPGRSVPGEMSRFEKSLLRDPREVWGGSSLMDFDHWAEVRENLIKQGVRLPTDGAVVKIPNSQTGETAVAPARAPGLTTVDVEADCNAYEDESDGSWVIDDTSSDEGNDEEPVIVNLTEGEAYKGRSTGWLRRVHAYCSFVVGRKIGSDLW